MKNEIKHIEFELKGDIQIVGEPGDFDEDKEYPINDEFDTVLNYIPYQYFSDDQLKIKKVWYEIKDEDDVINDAIP